MTLHTIPKIVRLNPRGLGQQFDSLESTLDPFGSGAHYGGLDVHRSHHIRKLIGSRHG